MIYLSRNHAATPSVAGLLHRWNIAALRVPGPVFTPTLYNDSVPAEGAFATVVPYLVRKAVRIYTEHTPLLSLKIIERPLFTSRFFLPRIHRLGSQTEFETITVTAYLKKNKKNTRSARKGSAGS